MFIKLLNFALDLERTNLTVKLPQVLCKMKRKNANTKNKITPTYCDQLSVCDLARAHRNRFIEGMLVNFYTFCFS